MSENHSDQTRWWKQIAAELRAQRDEQRDVFAPLSDELLSRFLAGEATEAEQRLVREAAERDPELQEALDSLTFALDDPAELPGEIPDAPRPIFACPAENSTESESDPEEAWQSVAAELRAHRDAQKAAWGDIDEAIIARFVAGECSTVESLLVKSQMLRHPELREAMEHVVAIDREDALVAATVPNLEASALVTESSQPHSPVLSFRNQLRKASRVLSNRGTLAAAASLLLAFTAVLAVDVSDLRTTLVHTKAELVESKETSKAEISQLQAKLADSDVTSKEAELARLNAEVAALKDDLANALDSLEAEFQDGKLIVSLRHTERRWVAEASNDLHPETGKKWIVYRPVSEVIQKTRTIPIPGGSVAVGKEWRTRQVASLLEAARKDCRISETVSSSFPLNASRFDLQNQLLEHAIELLELAASLGFSDARQLRFDPALTSLRGHPRFNKLLKQLESNPFPIAPQDEVPAPKGSKP